MSHREGNGSPPLLLAWKCHGQRAWGTTVHGVSRSQTYRDLTKKQHRYHEMITAIRLIIITSVISYRYLFEREKKRKENDRLHVDFCTGLLVLPQYGSSCVLRACIPTGEKWKLPASQDLSLKIGTRQHPPSAIIGQAVTEPAQIQAEETKVSTSQ